MMKIIGILWLRQLKRYVRSKPRMIGSLGQPLLFLFALGFGFGPIYQKASGGSYIEFLAPGIVAMSIIFTGIFGGIEIIWDRQFGFLKETLVAPVSRTSIMLGRTLGGATVAMAQGLIVLLITLLGGFRIVSLTTVPLAVVYMALIALLFTAFGTVIATKLNDMQAFPIVMNFLVMPLFFLSGALFPLEGLPRFIGLLARFDPLSYGVDGLRATLIGYSFFSQVLDLGVLVVASIFLLILGARFFGTIED